MKRPIETAPLISVVMGPDSDWPTLQAAAVQGRGLRAFITGAGGDAGDVQKSALAGRRTIGIQGPVKEMT